MSQEEGELEKEIEDSSQEAYGDLYKIQCYNELLRKQRDISDFPPRTDPMVNWGKYGFHF